MTRKNYSRMMFTKQNLEMLLRGSRSQRHELEKLYALLPKTRCHRTTRCCSLLPEITLLEALEALYRLVNMDSSVQNHLMKKILIYFFLNPVKITKCPFLDGNDCVIYQYRFFGCRAYGLWSRAYYDQLIAHSQKAKQYIQKQWENLGILLPEDVINFHVPYCSYVETIDHISMDDNTLLHIFSDIENVSQHFDQWHQSFKLFYFSDLSFLIASLIFGFQEAVHMKFDIVRNIITTGERVRLDALIGELPDPCSEIR